MKYAIIGNNRYFNNEKTQYRIDSFKRSQHEKCETIQTRKLTVKCKTEQFSKKINMYQQQPSTYRLFTWDRHNEVRCG